MTTLTLHNSNFALPLSAETFAEFENVQDILQNLEPIPMEVDERIFTWGTKKYTSAIYYSFIFERIPPDAQFYMGIQMRATQA